MRLAVINIEDIHDYLIKSNDFVFTKKSPLIRIPGANRLVVCLFYNLQYRLFLHRPMKIIKNPTRLMPGYHCLDYGQMNGTPCCMKLL